MRISQISHYFINLDYSRVKVAVDIVASRGATAAIPCLCART
jgi:hypothetical protein